MLLTSLVFLLTYPRNLLALAHCSYLLVPQKVIRDVNTEILLGRDIFKLKAGHVIVEDEGIKFPSDALRFAFAIVKV